MHSYSSFNGFIYLRFILRFINKDKIQDQQNCLFSFLWWNAFIKLVTTYFHSIIIFYTFYINSSIAHHRIRRQILKVVVLPVHGRRVVWVDARRSDWHESRFNIWLSKLTTEWKVGSELGLLKGVFALAPACRFFKWLHLSMFSNLPLPVFVESINTVQRGLLKASIFFF